MKKSVNLWGKRKKFLLLGFSCLFLMASETSECGKACNALKVLPKISSYEVNSGSSFTPPSSSSSQSGQKSFLVNRNVSQPCFPFEEIQKKSRDIVVFVHGEMGQDDASGESWTTAVSTITTALNIVKRLRAELQRTANRYQNPLDGYADIKDLDKELARKSDDDLKKVMNKAPQAYIIVAGGTYTHDKEIQAAQKNSGVGGKKSLLSFEGVDANYLNNTEILGGYKFGDVCRAQHENPDFDASDGGRTTILDGQSKSLHVASFQQENLDGITIADMTLKGGRAQSSAVAKGTDGGGVFIGSNAKNIKLVNLSIEDSQAEKFGGCVAISDKASHITLSHVNMKNCFAKRGSALYIGSPQDRSNAFDVGPKNIKITGSYEIVNDSKPDWGVIEENGYLGFEDEKDQAAAAAIFVQGNVGNGIELSGLWVGNNPNMRGIHLRRGFNNAGNLLPTLSPGDTSIFLTESKIFNHDITALNANGGGLLANTIRKLSLKNLKFEGNQAKNGGGMHLMDPPDSFTNDLAFDGVVFQNNKAQSYELDGGFGGAVSIESPSTSDPSWSLWLDNSKFLNNLAQKSGGALAYIPDDEAMNTFEVNSTIFQGNKAAEQHGGAIAINGALTTFRTVNSKFLNNLAQKSGGAMAYIPNDEAMGTFEVNSTIFQGNEATEENGGAIAINSALTTFRTVNSLFDSNSATSGYGGAIFLQKSVTSFEAKAHQITSNLGALSELAAKGLVFGVGTERKEIDKLEYNYKGKPQKVVANLFNHNQAQSGGALYFGGHTKTMDFRLNKFQVSEEHTKADGTKINVDFNFTGGNNRNIAGAIFEENTAEHQGGAIYANLNHVVTFAPNITISNGVFNRNEVLNNEGGAIYFSGNDSPKITIKRGTYNGNRSIIAGAAIALSDTLSTPSLEIKNATFKNHVIPEEGVVDSDVHCGGAVTVVGALLDLTLNSVVAQENVSKGAGGALCVLGNIYGNVDVSGGEYSDNIAKNSSGGAIAIKSQVTGNVSLTSANFSKNKTTYGPGGAIAFEGNVNGNVTLASWFSKNEAQGNDDKGNLGTTGYGGAVSFLENIAGDVVVSGGSFSSNASRLSAAEGADASYLDGGAVYFAQGINGSFRASMPGSFTANNNQGRNGGVFYIPHILRNFEINANNNKSLSRLMESAVHRLVNKPEFGNTKKAYESKAEAEVEKLTSGLLQNIMAANLPAVSSGRRSELLESLARIVFFDKDKDKDKGIKYQVLRGRIKFFQYGINSAHSKQRILDVDKSYLDDWAADSLRMICLNEDFNRMNMVLPGDLRSWIDNFNNMPPDDFSHEVQQQLDLMTSSNKPTSALVVQLFKRCQEKYMDDRTIANDLADKVLAYAQEVKYLGAKFDGRPREFFSKDNEGNAQWSYNRASQSGGVFWVGQANNVTVDNNFFSSNSADDSGGALYIANIIGNFQAKEVFFSQNQAGDGGAIYVENVGLNVEINENRQVLDKEYTLSRSPYFDTPPKNTIGVTVPYEQIAIKVNPGDMKDLNGKKDFYEEALGFFPIRDNHATNDGGFAYFGTVGGSVTAKLLAAQNIAGHLGGAIYIGDLADNMDSKKESSTNTHSGVDPIIYVSSDKCQVEGTNNKCGIYVNSDNGKGVPARNN